MFRFAWPWVFALLPLAWLVRRFLPIAKSIESAALRVPFFEKVKQLALPTNAGLKLLDNQKTLLAYGIWLLFIVAAARPVWLGPPQPVNRAGRNIMLAVDISGSMRVEDMGPQDAQVDRLSIVKKVADQFITQRQGDRIGLILFGTRAYLQTPLTFDRHSVKQMLFDASIGLAGPETAIGDAIALGVKRLSQVDEKSRVLIVLTDGANNAGNISPLQAADLAKQTGIKIYTIGIGADKMLVSGLFGQQVVNPSSNLDTTTLQEIADITGGKFFRAQDQSALRSVYHAVNKLEPIDSDQAIYRSRQDYFMWPLMLALTLVCFLVAKRLWVNRPEAAPQTHPKPSVKDQAC